MTGRAGNPLFDPDSGTWTATGKTITRGLGAGAAVLLPDGKVLVPGGRIYPRMLDVGRALRSGHRLLDRHRRHERTARRIPRPRYCAMARCSWRGDRPAPCSRPSPPSCMTRPAGPGRSPGPCSRWTRTTASATLLLDGTVLVTGSQRDPELYDPGTRSWIPFWTMLGPHGSAPATLLLDGRVLLAGGDGCSPDTGECGATRSAELYDPGARSHFGTATSVGPAPDPDPAPGPHPRRVLTDGPGSQGQQQQFATRDVVRRRGERAGPPGAAGRVRDPGCRATRHHR